MNKKILLIGGGGHCKSVIDSLLDLNEYTEIGIVDKKQNIGNSIMGIPIVGCDDDLLMLFNKQYTHAFVTVGSIGNPVLRIKLFTILSEIGYEIPVIIDPSSNVSKHSITIEQGVFVGKQSIVNAATVIKKGAIINSGSIVEHDCNIGKFAHISPGTVLGGEVVIGDNSHIGLNVTIKQQVTIGSNSIIGMGSVVLKNIKDNMLAYGNPCREMNKL